MSIALQGLPVCPGVAFGPVHLIDRARVAVPRYRVPPKHRDVEVARFEASIEASEAQLEALEAKADESTLEQVSTLLRAHAMILRDAAFYDATVQRIANEGQNAEWSLHATVREVRKLFDQMDKDFFRERRSDVDIVGDRVLRNLLGSAPDPLAELTPGAIIVAHDLTPADTLAMAREHVGAFVTEMGGRTSHTAILARALSVPCVLGVARLLDELSGGEDMVVDGASGAVVISPSAAERSQFDALSRRRNEEEVALLADRDLNAETRDGFRVRLLGNVEVRQEVQSIKRMGGEGVGLYRTEFLSIDGVDVDDARSQADAYAEIVRLMGELPVTIRTFDHGGDKDFEPPPSPWSTSADLPPTPTEGALGLRAIRLSLRDPRRFRTQVEAVLRAASDGQVRLLLPFLTDINELRAAREIIESVRGGLDARGVAYGDVEVGAMLETPAAVICLRDFEPLVDFFSVGTNDLVQFIMAADRRDETVAHLVRPSHPAILRTLHRIQQDATKPVSLCGEMAADPFVAPLLVGMGFRELSMSPASIPVVKRMIRRLEQSACAELTRSCLEASTADDVEAAVTAALEQWTPELFGVTA